MTELFPVHGTNGFLDNPDPSLPRNWWRAGSPLARELARHDIEYLHPEDPYCWDGDLDGLFVPPRHWMIGGRSLRWWVTAKGIPLARRRCWCHSHGLAPVLHAAAAWHEDQFLECLVSFGSPLREDHPYAAALEKIGRWLIVTDSHDRVQALGRLGDRAWGSANAALENERVQILTIDHIDHSRLLQDSSMFPLLEEHGILAFTRGSEI